MTVAPVIPLFERGELLTAARLEREQQAYRDALRRHRLLTHTPGVLVGLWVTGGGDAEDHLVDPLELQPGYAVDDFGRELLLPGPVALDARVGAELGIDPLAEAFVVALRLRRQLAAGYEIEEVLVDLIRPDDLPDPPTVVPERLPDETAEPSPPLAVGCLYRAGVNWRFTTEKRREAGVIAAAVRRKRDDREPWLRLSEGGGDRDSVEFLLPHPSVRPNAHGETNGTSENGDTDTAVTALTLTRSGAQLHGETRFTDTVEVDGALAFSEPLAVEAAAQSADYHGGPTFTRRNSDGTDELRLVLGKSDAQFVIAAPPEPGKEPKAILTVEGDGSVVIDADVMIEGKLIEGKLIEEQRGRHPPKPENGSVDDVGGGGKSEQKEGPMKWLASIADTIKGNTTPFVLGFLAALVLMVIFPEYASEIAEVIAKLQAAPK
jgi:hypothetical protein